MYDCSDSLVDFHIISLGLGQPLSEVEPAVPDRAPCSDQPSSEVKLSEPDEIVFKIFQLSFRSCLSGLTTILKLRRFCLEID
jgi:hypothetical protein